MILLEESVPVLSTFFWVSCAMSAHEERYFTTPCIWIGLARSGCAGDVISNWHTLPNHGRPSSWVFGTLGALPCQFLDFSDSAPSGSKHQGPMFCRTGMIRKAA